MNYLYVALQSSADRAARSDTALPGTIARPDSEIITTTITVEIFGSEAEVGDNPFLEQGDIK